MKLSNVSTIYVNAPPLGPRSSANLGSKKKSQLLESIFEKLTSTRVIRRGTS